MISYTRSAMIKFKEQRKIILLWNRISMYLKTSTARPNLLKMRILEINFNKFFRPIKLLLETKSLAKAKKKIKMLRSWNQILLKLILSVRRKSFIKINKMKKKIQII